MDDRLVQYLVDQAERRKRKQLIIIFSSVFIFLAIVVISKIYKPDKALIPDKYEAQAMAHHFVKQNLLAPSTAEFSSTSETSIIEKGDFWEISGYVDSQNAFGAMIRKRFFVKVEYKADQAKWKLIDINLF